MKNELITIKAEYLPDLKKEDVKDVIAVSKELLPELGLLSQSSGKGLYKCVFPNGVTGELAKKDGANLGTIINDKGIAGQARWVEQSVNPTMLFATAALQGIEEKLDEIISIEKDLFEYEHVKDEANLNSDVESLKLILRDYKSNIGNQLWLNSKATIVAQCENKALAFIDQYKKLAENASKDSGFMDKLVHTNDKAADKIEKTIRYFEDYQRAVFLFAFSKYVHILVTESYDENYLNNVQRDIEKLSSTYRDVFSDVSLQLEEYSKGSLDLKALKLAGDAAKAIGDFAEKAPLLKKTNAGKFLDNAGNNMEEYTEKSIDEKIKKVSKYQKAPVFEFVENIKKINNINHSSFEIYYDDNNIYLENNFA